MWFRLCTLSEEEYYEVGDTYLLMLEYMYILYIVYCIHKYSSVWVYIHKYISVWIYTQIYKDNAGQWSGKWPRQPILVLYIQMKRTKDAFSSLHFRSWKYQPIHLGCWARGVSERCILRKCWCNIELSFSSRFSNNNTSRGITIVWTIQSSQLFRVQTIALTSF